MWGGSRFLPKKIVKPSIFFLLRTIWHVKRRYVSQSERTLFRPIPRERSKKANYRIKEIEIERTITQIQVQATHARSIKQLSLILLLKLLLLLLPKLAHLSRSTRRHILTHPHIYVYIPNVTFSSSDCLHGPRPTDVKRKKQYIQGTSRLRFLLDSFDLPALLLFVPCLFDVLCF